MRLPHEMRLIGFDKYEYQLIGEIAVLSGMIEQQMKELIVKLVGAPWLDGIAIVAHQNFGSLCDIASSLLPSTVPSPGLQQSLRTAIKNAKARYDERSQLVHGPFSLSPGNFKIDVAIYGSRPNQIPRLSIRSKQPQRDFSWLDRCSWASFWMRSATRRRTRRIKS